MELPGLDVIAWAFGAICLFGILVNSVGAVWPAANTNRWWQRIRAALDALTTIALLICAGLFLALLLRLGS